MVYELHEYAIKDSSASLLSSEQRRFLSMLHPQVKKPKVMNAENAARREYLAAVCKDGRIFSIPKTGDMQDVQQRLGQMESRWLRVSVVAKCLSGVDFQSLPTL